MRALPRLVSLPFLLAQVGLAQAPPSSLPSSQDPILQGLVQEALSRNPDLMGATEGVAAEKERVPQASSLPDPILSLGYQNDSFNRIEYGRMETTWGTIMATQAFPYPGKRRLRAEVVQQGVKAAEAGLERLRLSLEADVRRSYMGLLLVRGQLLLFKDQELLWEKAEAIAKIRYETGQGNQVDLLRAQVERTRLKQTRAGLIAEERNRITELNRLASRPLEAPLETVVSLETLSVAEAPADALADAARRSPELTEAQHHLRHFQSRVDLARLDLRPDFSVSAGVMPRGALAPMWQVGFSVSLPIYARTKQQRAIAENEALGRGGERTLENLRQILAQQTQTRLDQLTAAKEIISIYREGLLTQSEATVQSAIAQYQVGRASFASVLEALTGYVSDRDRYLNALAQAQGLSIALQEVNLGPTPGIGGGASAVAGAMSGGASAGSRSSVRSASASSSKSGSTASTAQSGM